MLQKDKKNPIIKPLPFFGKTRIYNPGLIVENNKYFLFCRSKSKFNISTIVIYISNDGVKFSENKRVIVPGFSIDKAGVEDSRIVKTEKGYLMTYTSFDGLSARLSVASSSNLYNWKKHGEALLSWNASLAGMFNVPWDRFQHNETAQRDWSKSGGIFPQLFNGKYYMLFGDRNIYVADSRDGINWHAFAKPFAKPRSGFFDSVHIEMGPPPIKTKKGWLVIYHGIDEKAVYRLGYMLLDIDNPLKIIYRSEKFFMEPDQEYELLNNTDMDICGNVFPKVIFCNGAHLASDKLVLYYGASDRFVCRASIDLSDLFQNY